MLTWPRLDSEGGVFQVDFPPGPPRPPTHPFVREVGAADGAAPEVHVSGGAQHRGGPGLRLGPRGVAPVDEHGQQLAGPLEQLKLRGRVWGGGGGGAGISGRGEGSRRLADGRGCHSDIDRDVEALLLTGCTAAYWMYCCLLDVLLLTGCTAAYWMYCCLLDVLLLTGCTAAHWMYCCLLDVLLLAGCTAAHWMYCCSLDVQGCTAAYSTEGGR